MEEHKIIFSNYITQWIHLDVPSHYKGELGSRQMDYADIKHCIQCDGYREHWSQLGTVAERIKFQYGTEYEKMHFYCGCGREMYYNECVGSRSTKYDIFCSPMLQMTLLQFLCYRLAHDYEFDPVERMEKERALANLSD